MFVHQVTERKLCAFGFMLTHIHMKKTNWNYINLQPIFSMPPQTNNKLIESFFLSFFNHHKTNFLLFHSIRHATSRQMEAVIWSSVKKHQPLVTRVVRQRLLLTLLNNHHLESMAASRCRRTRCRRHRHRVIEIYIFHHHRNRVHATRRTKRRHTSCTWKSIL